MNLENDIAIIVSSCDLYEDAWNPFFRLLEANWPTCPRKIYLLTESKKYVDSYFNIICIHSPKSHWSDRMIYALNTIQEQYVWFFLEDFFLEDTVNIDIVQSALSCIQTNNVGVVKFIPRVNNAWYDSSEVVGSYFSPVPVEYTTRANLMTSLYKKSYFLKLLRKKETPWDFEKFAVYRSRKYTEMILLQNNRFPLAFPYNYELSYGMGITKRKWLRNNPSLFQKHNVVVNFDNLGFYEEIKEDKILGLGRSKKEKLLLPLKDPKLFIKILRIELRPLIYNITHFLHYF